MDKFFDEFYNYASFGPAIDEVIPTASFCNDYKDILPDQLIKYWQQYGFSGWGEGLFWIVNPSDYQQLLKSWLEGTPFEGRNDFHVIARSAFGQIFIWGENDGHCLDIQPAYGMIYPNTGAKDKLIKRGKDKSIQYLFASTRKSECDLKDESEHPLFQRAKEKLGQLSHDEIYAFVPALALGGRAELKHLQKVKIIEHLSFLADLGEKRIMHDVNKVLGSVS